MTVFNVEELSKNATINRKIAYILALSGFLAIFLCVLMYYGNKTITATRAFVTAESYWSKARNNATKSLTSYLYSQDSSAYTSFKKSLKIPKGDRKARLALSSEDPNIEAAREGFLQGGNPPRDIERLIWIFSNFRNTPIMRPAISIWKQGDRYISKLDSLGKVIHQAIINDRFTKEKRQAYLSEVAKIDYRLTVLEKTFTRKMAQTANQVSSWIWWITVGVGAVSIMLIALISVRMLGNVRKINRSLDNSRKKLKNILENSRDIIFQYDIQEDQIDYVSRSVNKIMGYDEKELKEGGIDLIRELVHPDDRDAYSQNLKQLQQSDNVDLTTSRVEIRLQHKEGHYIWIDSLRTLLTDEQGRVSKVISNVRDITQSKRREQQLDRALKEREILLNEVHHRVKNNMAIISGLLELQKDRLIDEAGKNALNDSQLRIQTMAEVHEKLYNEERWSDIDARNYLSSLLDKIKASYQRSNIEIRSELQSFKLNVNQAIPLGLMLNEVVTNAYQHAFKENQQGSISISVNLKDDKVYVEVEDDGIGIDVSSDVEEKTSLGFTIIRTLKKQLEASLDISSNGRGTKVSLSFDRQAIKGTVSNLQRRGENIDHNKTEFN